MGDVRRCGSVAVYASVGDGVYGDMKVVEALVLVWVESRVEGYVGLGRYGVRGKKGRGGSSFLIFGRFMGVWEQWERM